MRWLFIIMMVLFCITSLAEEYLGEIWQNTKGEGAVEYIIDTSQGLSNDFGQYVVDNNIPIKQYAFFRKSAQTGEIIKCIMFDTLDEAIAERNKGQRKKW